NTMMTTTQRRIALLTGASLATLGIASPALAAPHTGHATGVFPGASTTADTVVICDIASATPTPLQSPPPCFFGVIDTTSPAVAVVNAPANGQITQHQTGSTVALDMINNGS